MAPIWTVYNIGPYSMSEIKVYWRQFIPDLRMAVGKSINHPILGTKIPITQHVVTFVPFSNEHEANYFCALGNSSICNFIHKNYSTSKSYGAPHILKYLKIPKFDPQISLHCSLSEFSAQAHEQVLFGNIGKLNDTENQIDQAAAELWGITKGELSSIRKALR